MSDDFDECHDFVMNEYIDPRSAIAALIPYPCQFSIQEMFIYSLDFFKKGVVIVCCGDVESKKNILKIMYMRVVNLVFLIG